MGLWSDGNTSAVEILADRFAIVDPDNAATVQVPFIVDNGAVYMSNAMIKNAAITTAKIADAAITAAKIGEAQVETLKIKGNAVTIQKVWRPVDASIPEWSTVVVATFTVNVPAGANLSGQGNLITVSYKYTNAGGTGWYSTAEVKKGAAVIGTGAYLGFNNLPAGTLCFSAFDDNIASGDNTYTLSVTTDQAAVDVSQAIITSVLGLR
ncbi:MAG: hypothetical protein A2075_12445 [Geobacteraceae bacterium GWC2_58_44]|nr:MAG: hypothetical protein A2075_12445 [Geobacteraceae bacterium GWC2_58_44]